MLYAVGDIHGEREMLEELLDGLSLSAEDRLVFVGDYVDRGPDSHGVVELLIQLAESHRCESRMAGDYQLRSDLVAGNPTCLRRVDPPSCSPQSWLSA